MKLWEAMWRLGDRLEEWTRWFGRHTNRIVRRVTGKGSRFAAKATIVFGQAVGIGYDVMFDRDGLWWLWVLISMMLAWSLVNTANEVPEERSYEILPAALTVWVWLLRGPLGAITYVGCFVSVTLVFDRPLYAVTDIIDGMSIIVCLGCLMEGGAGGRTVWADARDRIDAVLTRPVVRPAIQPG